MGHCDPIQVGGRIRKWTRACESFLRHTFSPSPSRGWWEYNPKTICSAWHNMYHSIIDIKQQGARIYTCQQDCRLFTFVGKGFSIFWTGHATDLWVEQLFLVQGRLKMAEQLPLNPSSKINIKIGLTHVPDCLWLKTTGSLSPSYLVPLPEFPSNA